MAKKALKPVRVNIQNKRAKHEYLIVDRLKAGIVLTGTEIKSIRAGKASLVDTFCFVLDGEMWVKNMYIAPYELGSYNNHASRRDRKLLLNRKEIRNLQNDASSPGYTIVPLRLFIDENGRAKLEIALCKGKREFDKRASLRERDDKREMYRIRKSF